MPSIIPNVRVPMVHSNAPDQTNKQEQDDSADRGAQNCEHVTGAQMNAIKAPITPIKASPAMPIPCFVTTFATTHAATRPTSRMTERAWRDRYMRFSNELTQIIRRTIGARQ